MCQMDSSYNGLKSLLFYSILTNKFFINFFRDIIEKAKFHSIKTGNKD